MLLHMEPHTMDSYPRDTYKLRDQATERHTFGTTDLDAEKYHVTHKRGLKLVVRKGLKPRVRYGLKIVLSNA